MKLLIIWESQSQDTEHQAVGEGDKLSSRLIQIISPVDIVQKGEEN
jgi:hypothetical protein